MQIGHRQEDSQYIAQEEERLALFGIIYAM